MNISGISTNPGTKSATPAFPGRNSLYIRTTSNELQPMRLHTEKKEEVKW